MATNMVATAQSSEARLVTHAECIAQTLGHENRT